MAQDWCMPGATWVYRFEDMMSDIDYRVEDRYTHDTLIDGFLAQVIAVHAFGTDNGGGTIDDYSLGYERTDGEIIYSGSAGNWDTLYWFGDIGDRWWPIGSAMTCPPQGMLEIVDTGHVTMGPLTLKTWDLVYLDSLGQTMSGPLPITERIGTVPRQPEIWDCFSAIDYFDAYFICYSDSELVALGEEACAIDVGVADRFVDAEFSITPNPTNGPFTLRCDQGGIGGVISIFNPLGRRIMQQSMRDVTQVIDLSSFKPGCYRVVLIQPDGPIGTRSLMKY